MTKPDAGIASSVSRRTFLRVTAAATTVAAFGGVASAQDAAETFELGGETQGWQGQSPDSISGQTNPTLQLTVGQTYEITWENVDGAPHNIAILDSQGSELESTEIMSEQGQTQTLTFEATEDMAEYYCAVHPNTMRGSIELSQDGGGTQTQTGTPTETQTETPSGVTPDETPSIDQPGFGVLAALAGVAGGIVHRLRKRD